MANPPAGAMTQWTANKTGIHRVSRRFHNNIRTFYGSCDPEDLGIGQSKAQIEHPLIYKQFCSVCYRDDVDSCQKDYCHRVNILVGVATTAKKLPDGTPTILLDAKTNLSGQNKPQRFNAVKHVVRVLPGDLKFDARLNDRKITVHFEREENKIKEKDD